MVIIIHCTCGIPRKTSHKSEEEITRGKNNESHVCFFLIIKTFIVILAAKIDPMKNTFSILNTSLILKLI